MIHCLSLKEIIPPIIPLEQQFEIVTSNKATCLGLAKRAQDLKQTKFCPILANFFVVANLRTIWNAFTGSNTPIL